MDIEAVINKYGSILYRICFINLGNKHDAEDALQETFFRYMRRPPHTNDSEHEKAWFIRVATNICRDMRRFQLRHNYVQLEDVSEYLQSEEQKEILEEVLALPLDLKNVIYLHYIEGYKISEIANILKLSDNAVKKRLQRGREQLRIKMEELIYG